MIKIRAAEAYLNENAEFYLFPCSGCSLTFGLRFNSFQHEKRTDTVQCIMVKKKKKQVSINCIYSLRGTVIYIQSFEQPH